MSEISIDTAAYERRHGEPLGRFFSGNEKSAGLGGFLKRRRPKLGRQFRAVARWSFAFRDLDQSIAGDDGTLGGFCDIAKGN
jgi:hypothetical protein